MTAGLPARESEAALRRAARLAARLVLSRLASQGRRSGLAIEALRIRLAGAGGGETILTLVWRPESADPDGR